MMAITPPPGRGAMTESEINSGERAEHRRRRGRLMLFVSLGIAGLVTGIYIGSNSSTSSGTWFGDVVTVSPTVALILAFGYVAAVMAGGFMLRRQTDEVELLGRYKTSALAGGMFMLVYPVWFLLWKGGLVPEPIHGILFLLFLLTAIVGSIFYRVR